MEIYEVMITREPHITNQLIRKMSARNLNDEWSGSCQSHEPAGVRGGGAEPCPPADAEGREWCSGDSGEHWSSFNGRGCREQWSCSKSAAGWRWGGVRRSHWGGEGEEGGDKANIGATWTGPGTGVRRVQGDGSRCSNIDLQGENDVLMAGTRGHRGPAAGAADGAGTGLGTENQITRCLSHN